MKIKNQSAVIAGIFIGLAILACNFAAGNNQPSAEGNPAQPSSMPPAEAATDSVPTQNSAPSSAGACTNSYMPVVIGASWNYKMTGTTSDTYTHSILSTDGTSFTDQDVFTTGATRQGQWKCDNGSLIALNPSNGGSASVNTQGVTVNFQTTALSGVTVPANIAPGNTWSQSVTLEGTESINGTDIPAKNKFDTSCTAVGVESVTVTAGTFDAMHVDCQINMNITITMQGNEIPTSLNMTTSSWYAPNIGMVKSVSTSTNLNTVIELISYNIP